MGEVWKPVKNFEGVYEVSTTGNLRSVDHYSCGKFWKGKIKARTVDTSGYIVDVLCYEGKQKKTRRHRLVAEAFIPNPENKKEVNHKDGNKQNNTVENLEWATHRENTDHAWLMGLTRVPDITEKKVVQMYEGKRLAVYRSMLVAENLTGIDSTSINQCCRGKRKSAGGYEWGYEEGAEW